MEIEYISMDMYMYAYIRSSSLSLCMVKYINHQKSITDQSEEKTCHMYMFRSHSKVAHVCPTSSFYISLHHSTSFYIIIIIIIILIITHHSSLITMFIITILIVLLLLPVSKPQRFPPGKNRPIHDLCINKWLYGQKHILYIYILYIHIIYIYIYMYTCMYIYIYMRIRYYL